MLNLNKMTKKIAVQLEDAGYTVASLGAASVDELAQFRGVTKERAAAIIESAQAATLDNRVSQEAPTRVDEPQASVRVQRIRAANQGD